MYNNTHGWLWKFESNLAVHGATYAAQQAKQQGVPVSMAKQALTLLQGAK